jgi:hypothetical protein
MGGGPVRGVDDMRASSMGCFTASPTLQLTGRRMNMVYGYAFE